MRYIVFAFITFFFMFSYSQTIDLRRMDNDERNIYLEKIAREVTSNFGPDYIKDSMIVKISEIKTYHVDQYKQNILEYKKVDGKRYYTVTLAYNQELEKQPFRNASVTNVWENDGQPYSVMFGGGRGVEFIKRPYAEWIREGIEDAYIVKFDHYEKYREIVYPVEENNE